MYLKELLQHDNIVYSHDMGKDKLLELISMHGAIFLLDNNSHLSGIITDGDLRRMLENDLAIIDTNIITSVPISMNIHDNIPNIFKIMKESEINILPVVND